jgi:hypothetical protein
MKKEFTFLLLLALFIPFPVFACNIDEGTARQEFDRLDLDHNGTLSEDEYYKNEPLKFMPQEKRDERFKEIDKDNNGIPFDQFFQQKSASLRC